MSCATNSFFLSSDAVFAQQFDGRYFHLLPRPVSRIIQSVASREDAMHVCQKLELFEVPSPMAQRVQQLHPSRTAHRAAAFTAAFTITFIAGFIVSFPLFHIDPARLNNDPAVSSSST
jgi:hypothetical protein